MANRVPLAIRPHVYCETVFTIARDRYRNHVMNALVVTSTAVFVVGLLWPLTAALRRGAILDTPGHRSSHDLPTPRGAGLVVVPVVLLGWILPIALGEAAAIPGPVLVVSLSALALLAVSWVDDIRNVSPVIRLGLHFCFTIAGVTYLDDAFRLFPEFVPFVLERALIVVCWVWFINLFNFMDGIDGISAVECLVIAGGILALGTITSFDGSAVLLAAAVVGGALGFLPWNWHRAKVFLGDCGSAPLGYLLGWLLLSLAQAGYWAPALVLPAYYLIDSGITLLRRLMRGERIWEAHRQHAYQVGARKWGHRRVSGLLAIVGGGLIGAAWLAASGYLVAGLLTGWVLAALTYAILRAGEDDTLPV